MAEGTEFFNVNLELPINAMIADGTGGVTIIDNDNPLTRSGKEAVMSEVRVSAYPNPFNSFVKMSIPSTVNETATVSLADMQGKILRQRTV